MLFSCVQMRAQQSLYKFTLFRSNLNPPLTAQGKVLSNNSNFIYDIIVTFSGR